VSQATSTGRREIALLARGNQSPAVRSHAINALNFQLLWSIIGVLAWSISWRLPVILPLLAVTIIGVTFGIIGGLRANENRPYTYPITASLMARRSPPSAPRRVGQTSHPP
jgi:uncharacterized Tic20 family protein